MVESGNFDRYSRIGEYEYNIYIKKDIFTTNASLWFNFMVVGMETNNVYLFHIIGLNKVFTTHVSGQKILVKSKSNLNWQRLPFEQ